MAEPGIPLEIAVLASVATFFLALLWSYLMASRVAPPRAKRLILETLQDPEAPEVAAVRGALIAPEIKTLHGALNSSQATLEKHMAEFEGRIRAELPPNVDARVAAVQEDLGKVHEGIQRALGTLEAELNDLPDRIRMAVLSARGVQERKIRKAMTEAGEEIEVYVQEEAGDLLEGPEAEFLRWVRKPVDPEYESANPTGAAALRILKAAVGREFAPSARRGAITPYTEGKSLYGL